LIVAIKINTTLHTTFDRNRDGLGRRDQGGLLLLLLLGMTTHGAYEIAQDRRT